MLQIEIEIDTGAFAAGFVLFLFFAANPQQVCRQLATDKERGGEETLRLLLSSRLLEYALQFQVSR